MYGYYIHDKLDMTLEFGSSLYDNIIDFDDFDLDEDELYSCFIENSLEMHYFVLTVKGNNLILNSTYGGQEEIINKKFNENLD